MDLNIPDSTVFYTLKYQNKRLRISKTELLTLKMELLSGKRKGTVYQSTELVRFSDMVQHSSRKRIWRRGEPDLKERLLPATASITVQ